MLCYSLSSVLVRSTQAARLFVLLFLRTCHRLILVHAAEGPSYPTRLEVSTPASHLVEQQHLQTIFFKYCQSICHRLTRSTTFFSPSSFYFLHEYGGFAAEILPSTTAFFVRNWRIQLDNATGQEPISSACPSTEWRAWSLLPACVLAWHESNRERLGIDETARGSLSFINFEQPSWQNGRP